LAGSSLTLDRAIVNAMRCTGLPIEAVAPMASTIPASLVGAATSGCLAVDWDADTVDLRIVEVTP